MPIRTLYEIENELTELLANLIRIDTTNPPGNETKAAKFVAKYLSEDGLSNEILESAPERGNLVARLKGTGEKPNLLLLSHLDVVAANAKEWSMNPFAGTIKDGYVYGRGAIDMKSLLAIQLVVMKLLKRNKVKLKGDVVLAATADEEQGSVSGARFLLEQHKDKVWCPYVITEGGGLTIHQKKGDVLTIQTAEKGIFWFKIKISPAVGNNSILIMSKVIKQINDYQPEIRFIPTLKHFLNAMSKYNPDLKDLIEDLLRNPKESDEILKELAKKDKALAENIWPRIRTTITPTIIKGDVKENTFQYLPRPLHSESEAVFDCRVLPGETVAETFKVIRSLLEDCNIEKLTFETIQRHDGTESQLETPLYNIIVDVVKEFKPGFDVLPIFSTVATDSRFFRDLGSVCYGFQPVIPDEPNDQLERRIHGVDERITTENLVFGATTLYEIVKRFSS